MRATSYLGTHLLAANQEERTLPQDQEIKIFLESPNSWYIGIRDVITYSIPAQSWSRAHPLPTIRVHNSHNRRSIFAKDQMLACPGALSGRWAGTEVPSILQRLPCVSTSVCSFLLEHLVKVYLGSRIYQEQLKLWGNLPYPMPSLRCPKVSRTRKAHLYRPSLLLWSSRNLHRWLHKGAQPGA